MPQGGLKGDYSDVFSRAIVHECNPGTSPQNTLDQLGMPEVDLHLLGIEVDVASKRSRTAGGSEEYVPCAISRDSKFRVKLQEHLQSFTEAGFHGPFMLDLVNRRKSDDLVKLNVDRWKPDAVDVMLFVPDVVLGFKTPWAHHHGVFEVQDFWRNSWEQIVISTRNPSLITEFLCEGVKPIVLWEPIDNLDYRCEVGKILEKVNSVIYKLPHLNYSASYDFDHCLEGDLELARSLPACVEIIPSGSVELLRSLGIVGRQISSREDELNAPSEVMPLVPNIDTNRFIAIDQVATPDSITLEVG